MAKEPQKKTRWYKLIAQAYQTTAPTDKLLLPYMLVAVLVPIAISLVAAWAIGGIPALIYCLIFGIMFGILAGLFTLTRRFEKNAFARMDGVVGGSLAVAQSIRNGWAFEENPEAVDTKGRAVVFRGVGKTGIVLIAEGGGPAHRLVDTASKRITKLVPGVPVRPIYVGNGQGQVKLTKLTKEIRKGKTVLSRGELDKVAARLHAIGGARMPVPKGIDPLRARPDRKATRGR